jgi:hypothetical protein
VVDTGGARRRAAEGSGGALKPYGNGAVTYASGSGRRTCVPPPLDWLNFLVADVRGGLGPYVTDYGWRCQHGGADGSAFITRASRSSLGQFGSVDNLLHDPDISQSGILGHKPF